MDWLNGQEVNIFNFYFQSIFSFKIPQVISPTLINLFILDHYITNF